MEDEEESQESERVMLFFVNLLSDFLSLFVYYLLRTLFWSAFWLHELCLRLSPPFSFSNPSSFRPPCPSAFFTRSATLSFISLATIVPRERVRSSFSGTILFHSRQNPPRTLQNVNLYTEVVLPLPNFQNVSAKKNPPAVI